MDTPSVDVVVAEEKVADVRNVPKHVLKKFIETYKKNPALWQIKNKELYTNKKLKYKEWQELVKIWKSFDDDADIKMVKAKVQSLRGSFRKEMKKVEKSQKSGAGTDDLYIPQLWYFKLMTFVSEHEFPTEGVDNINSPEPMSQGSQPEHYDEELPSSSEGATAVNDTTTAVVLERPALPEAPTRRKKTKTTEEDERKQFLQACTKALQIPPERSQNEAFGIFITRKLDLVKDEFQRLHAETLIHKIVSYAVVGKLNEFSDIQLDPVRVVTALSSVPSSHNSFAHGYMTDTMVLPTGASTHGLSNDGETNSQMSLTTYYDHFSPTDM